MCIKILLRIDGYIVKFCTSGLVLSVAVMLILSLLNIVLRWFGQSFLWVDPVVRHTVFLAAFWGAALAVGNTNGDATTNASEKANEKANGNDEGDFESKGNHIAIDLVSRWMDHAGHRDKTRLLRLMVGLVSFVCLVGLVVASIGAVTVEMIAGAEVFLGVHSSYLVAIMPLGFALIGLRYLLVTIIDFSIP